jgi:endonuclease YncB( thermonuclease family)
MIPRMPWRRRRRSFDPLHPQLRRRRRYRRVTFAGLILLALTAVLDRTGVFRYDGDDWRNFDQKTFLVTHVADGDTIAVRPTAGGTETRVRLIGVDAPELHSRDDNSRPDYWARDAKRYTESRAERKTVTLRLEQGETRDKYRRLLAYVYVGDTENLNLNLVRDGQAYADRRFRHSMRAQFERAESEARKGRRGLWKDVKGDQMPPWRQEWLRRR